MCQTVLDKVGEITVDGAISTSNIKMDLLERDVLIFETVHGNARIYMILTNALSDINVIGILVNVRWHQLVKVMAIFQLVVLIVSQLLMYTSVILHHIHA